MEPARLHLISMSYDCYWRAREAPENLKASSSGWDVVFSQKFHYRSGFHQIKHQGYKPHLFHAPAKVAFNTRKAKPQESSPKPKNSSETGRDLLSLVSLWLSPWGLPGPTEVSIQCFTTSSLNVFSAQPMQEEGVTEGKDIKFPGSLTPTKFTIYRNYK